DRGRVLRRRGQRQADHERLRRLPASEVIAEPTPSPVRIVSPGLMSTTQSENERGRPFRAMPPLATLLVYVPLPRCAAAAFYGMLVLRMSPLLPPRSAEAFFHS